MSEYRAALALEPGFLLARTNLANALLHSGDPEAARTQFARVFRADPDNAIALEGAAELAVADGKPDDAIAQLVKAAAAEPLEPRPLARAGKIAMDAGREDDAKRYLDQALEIDPGYLPAFAFLAAMDLVKGDYPAAEKIYRDAADYAPDDAGAQVAHARILALMKKWDQALVRYKRAVALAPDNAEYLLQLGQCLQALGRQEAALAELEQARQTRPRQRRHLPVDGRQPARPRPQCRCDRRLQEVSGARQGFADAAGGRAVHQAAVGLTAARTTRPEMHGRACRIAAALGSVHITSRFSSSRGRAMQPELAILILWLAWGASWMAAFPWVDPASRRAGLRAELGYWIAMGLGAALLFVPAFGYFGAPMIWRPGLAGSWSCVALVAAGAAFCWWARLRLGRLWSPGVALKPNHRVVDTGPYAIVRHPMYAGLLLAAYATVAAKSTPWAVAGALLVTLGVWMKARLEERFLRRELGEAYDAYAARVPMLVPFSRGSRLITPASHHPEQRAADRIAGAEGAQQPVFARLHVGVVCATAR